jgi:biopolymer transport protein TolR
MSMTFGSRNRQTAEMNLTPLIDVLLVLIIIFMVVMPHYSQGEPADIPQPSATDMSVPQPENNIVVQLLDRGDGKRPVLKINQSEVSWEDLATRMKDILQPRAQRVVFLKSDRDVEFQFVAQAVNLTRAAGADRVGLMPRAR